MQDKQLFSGLNKLESELVETLNDHIRLVQFGYDGDVEKIISLLRSVPYLRGKFLIDFFKIVCSLGYQSYAARPIIPIMLTFQI